MNITHIGKYYHPQVGGVEQAVRALAEGTAGPHYDVRVVAVTPSGGGTTEVVNGVEVRKLRSLGELASVPIAPRFPFELSTVDERADVLHFHLPNPGAVFSYLVNGSSDAKIVVTYHSDIVKQTTALRFYRPLLHRFLREADRITVTSPNLLRHSAHLEPYAAKSTVVPLSIDTDRFGQYAGPEYELPIDPSRPTLLFVGRLTYYKGVEYLVEAMQSVDADLLVVGDGDRRDKIEECISRKGVEDRVTLLGRVSDRKLHFCYETADLFVLPSVSPSEAFGIVQLEAMAYRTPVVNTSLPTGVPWVSRDGETGITVPPEDAAALAEAINRLVDDPDLRSRYGKSARKRVVERFCRDRMIRSMKEVYDGVVL